MINGVDDSYASRLRLFCLLDHFARGVNIVRGGPCLRQGQRARHNVARAILTVTSPNSRYDRGMTSAEPCPAQQGKYR